MSEEEPPEGGPPQGSVHPTGPGPLTVFGGIGLIVGWAIRPLTLNFGGAEPTVGWLPIGLIAFVAAAVAWAAYTTARGRRDGVRLEPHRAVNRLVMGKTCALVGALLAGGYFGFALNHLGGLGGSDGTTTLWHAALAGVAGLALMGAALWLELACRVDRDDE